MLEQKNLHLALLMREVADGIDPKVMDSNLPEDHINL